MYRNAKNHVMTFIWILMVLTVAGSGCATARQSWDKKIDNAAVRFQVLPQFADEAVLDHETQLVWEQNPDTEPMSWYGAVDRCYNMAVGGRKGWRLPTVEELTTLVDPTVAAPGPTIFSGHPFSNVQSSGSYWSITSHYATSDDVARLVTFHNGDAHAEQKVHNQRVWCVRGGHGHDNPPH